MLRHCEPLGFYSFFFFNDTATTEIYTLSLHDALPILETVVRLGLPMVIVVYDDEAYGAEVHHFGPDGFPLDTDRKSTRLNSSHMSISYAVFCLKKKKNDNTDQTTDHVGILRVTLPSPL